MPLQPLAAQDFTCNYLWNEDFARKIMRILLILRISWGEGVG